LLPFYFCLLPDYISCCINVKFFINPTGQMYNHVYLWSSSCPCHHCAPPTFPAVLLHNTFTHFWQALTSSTLYLLRTLSAVLSIKRSKLNDKPRFLQQKKTQPAHQLFPDTTHNGNGQQHNPSIHQFIN
jgi:hypothetical protein